MKIKLLCVSALMLVGDRVEAKPAQELLAGASKVEISPPANSLSPGDSLRDPLFVRAIMLSNGPTCAALIGMDQPGLSSESAKNAIQRASAATGCPTDNFIVSATHTHSGSSRNLMDPEGQPDATTVENALVKAIVDAGKTMRPARIGYGEARLDINVNRDALIDGRWMQAPNPNGPSDKALAIVEFVDAENRPIAVYMNYAMHPINFYLSGVVSADVPGEASRYVESHFGKDMVAVFAQGASGDQNPALTGPMLDLIAHRTADPLHGDKRVAQRDPWVVLASERNGNIRLNAALAKPVPDDQLAAYHSAIARTSEIVRAQGVLMGEKAIATMRFGITDLESDATIAGYSASLQCDGRDRLDRADPVRDGMLPPYADGAPVIIREGILRLGSTYILSINGEVYSEIASDLKQRASNHHVIFTTLANGRANSGYIYSDNAKDHLTFQVIDSRLKPGCAQKGIVTTGLGLIQRAENGK